LPLLAANGIGDGGDCDPLFPPPLPAPTIATGGCRCHWQRRCGGNGRSGDNEAFRSFFGVMFKILHIKSNILNIKLDEEGGGAEWNAAYSSRHTIHRQPPTQQFDQRLQ
jgi:hypothetical protein